MAGTSTYDPETGIRVVIKPSQSSFFAGEPFSVSITFINTRTPPEQLQPSLPSSHYLDPSVNSNGKPPTSEPVQSSHSRSYSHSHSHSQSALLSPTFRPPDSVPNVTLKRFHHKRGAHSISSAPLARPPTSPGTPRSPVTMNTPSLMARAKSIGEYSGGVLTGGDERLSRRGMIGTHGLTVSTTSLSCPRASSASISPSPASATTTDLDLNVKAATPVEENSAQDTQGTNDTLSSKPPTPVTLPELIEQRRKRQLGKSLSVTVSPPPRNEFDYGVTLAPSPSTPQSASFTNGELKRTHTLALAKSHPHARKDSLVLDGTNFLDAIAPQSSTPTTSSFPGSYPLSAIAEAAPASAGSRHPNGGFPLVPNTPMVGAPYIESGPSTPASGSFFHGLRTGIGLGHPSTATTHAYAPNHTGDELILYSYAQLLGQVIITPPISQTAGAGQPTRDQRAALTNLREKLLKKGKGGVVGGGSMDINSMLVLSSSGPYSSSSSLSAVPSAISRTSSDGQRHGRTSSLSGSLFALLSPSSLIGFGGSETHHEEDEEKHSPLHEGRGVETAPPGAAWKATDGNSGRRGLGLGIGLATSNGESLPRRSSPPVPPAMVKRTHSGQHNSPHSHGRKSSIGAFFGLGSADPTEVGASNSRRGGGSGILTLGGGSHSAEVLEDEDTKYEYASMTPLPTLETQPAMLAVDLTLRPGEERSYTYTLNLPDNLPPTFRGRSLKFSYEFVVGLCRAGPGNSKQNISKLMKVPIRLYNCIWVDRPLKVYNLIWPLHKRMDLAMPLSQARIVDGPLAPSSPYESAASSSSCRKNNSSCSASKPDGSLQEIQSYAKRLVGSLPPSSIEYDVSKRYGEGVDKEMEARVRRQEMSLDDENEEEPAISCREAVEILTRTPKKASYDVTKDGVKVAVLTLLKSSFRLGETVSGVVELNERKGRARVLQLSAFLEAHESLPSNISPPSLNRQLKRTYAEHFSNMLINTVRATFSLDIPSDASPAFQTSLGTTGAPGSLHQTNQAGGVEWKVRLSLLVAVASEYADAGTEGVRLKALVRDGEKGEWSSAWRALTIVKPLQKMGPIPPPVSQISSRMKGTHNSPYGQDRNGSRTTSASSWSAFFASYIMAGTGEKEYHDGDELEDDEDDQMSRSTNSHSGSRTGTRTSLDSSTYGSSNASIAGLGLGASEPETYDGVKADFAGGVGVGVDFEGGKDGWREVRVETVECEVPVRVWPGNTAFRALDVIFEV